MRSSSSVFVPSSDRYRRIDSYSTGGNMALSFSFRPREVPFSSITHSQKSQKLFFPMIRR